MKTSAIRSVLVAMIMFGAASVQAAPSDVVCKGVEVANDPHATVLGVSLTIDANDQAVLKTYEFPAFEAYVDINNALTNANLTSVKALEARFEHDNFGTTLHDVEGQFVVARIISNGEQSILESFSKDAPFSIDLTCNR